MGAPDVFLYHPSVIHQPHPPTRPRWPARLDRLPPAAPGGRRFRADWPRRALALGRWLVALGLMAGAFVGGKLLLDLEPEILPVRLVTVEGEVHRLSSQQLQRTVTEHLEGGLLTQDLKRLQRSVDDLPWVRTADPAPGLAGPHCAQGRGVPPHRPLGQRRPGDRRGRGLPPQGRDLPHDPGAAVRRMTPRPPWSPPTTSSGGTA